MLGMLLDQWSTGSTAGKTGRAGHALMARRRSASIFCGFASLGAAETVTYVLQTPGVV